MNTSNPTPSSNGRETYERLSPGNPVLDATPAIGITPPQILAQQAAAGRRGSAWRLLYRIVDNDPHAIVAVTSLDDDRLGWNLLECIALSTWAGKPFVVPTPLRSPVAKMRLGTLFLPATGIEQLRAARILNQAMHDSRPYLRATAASLLGLPGHMAAAPALIEALWDPAPAVQQAAVKALMRSQTRWSGM